MAGSDTPYAPADKIARFKTDIDNYLMEKDLRDKIYFKNALTILPRLAQEFSETFKE